MAQTNSTPQKFRGFNRLPMTKNFGVGMIGYKFIFRHRVRACGGAFIWMLMERPETLFYQYEP